MDYEITKKLKSDGFKLTKIRIGIVDAFIKAKNPLAAKDLIDMFYDLKIKVNKTTIYRELDFLVIS